MKKILIICFLFNICYGQLVTDKGLVIDTTGLTWRGGGTSIYTGDGSLSGYRIVTLSGNRLGFYDDATSNDLLTIDANPANQQVNMAVYNTAVGGSNASHSIGVNSSSANFALGAAFDNETTLAYILGNADATSATLTFNGSLIFNTVVSGASTDSILTRNPTTGEIRYRSPSLFGADSTVFQTNYRSDTMRADLYPAIALKLNKTDSVSGVASNYVTQWQRKKTSDSLQANITLKLNKSDTAAMLSSYQSAINTNTSNVALKLNKSDTTTLLAGRLGAKLDTASATKTLFTALRQRQSMLYDSINARWYNQTILIDSPEHNFSPAALITFTAGTAPSGGTNATYQWTQTGKLVVVRVNLSYAVAGATVTAMFMAWPSDLPVPFGPLGFTGSSGAEYLGVGAAATVVPSLPAAATKAGIRVVSGAPSFYWSFTSGSFIGFWLTVTYFTT